MSDLLDTEIKSITNAINSGKKIILPKIIEKESNIQKIFEIKNYKQYMSNYRNGYVYRHCLVGDKFVLRPVRRGNRRGRKVTRMTLF